jgi:hypothetical protein
MHTGSTMRSSLLAVQIGEFGLKSRLRSYGLSLGQNKKNAHPAWRRVGIKISKVNQ